MTGNGIYRAQIGDRTFTLSFEGERLLLDGEPVEHTFSQVGEQYFILQMDGRSTGTVVEPLDGGRLRVTMHGRRAEVQVKDEKDLLLERYGLDEGPAAAEREIHAPMPGLVLEVLVEEGDTVEAGAGLLVLEAMKMENELKAPAAGVVEAVHARAGEPVDKDALLLEIDTA